MSSPKKGMTTNSFLENTLNKSAEFNQTKDNMLTSKPYGDDISQAYTPHSTHQMTKMKPKPVNKVIDTDNQIDYFD